MGSAQATGAVRFEGEWEMTQVSDFGSVVTGGTPRTATDAYWGEEYPWITPTDISSSRDIVTSERMITGQGLAAIRCLPAHSVLVTCIASIGKNAILRTTGGCNQQINAIVPNTAHSADFIYYLFEYNAQHLLTQAGTTATPIVSKKAFSRLSFGTPSIDEQLAIAAVLSDLDELIGSLEALIAKKRAIKQAAMQELLTGRTRLPGFGGEWEARRISELAEVDPENLTSDTDPGFRFNYISLDNVVSGRLVRYSRESYGTAPSRARRVLRVRDILMSTVRPTLNGHLFYQGQATNAVCSTGFAVLRTKCDLCDPHFLFAHLFGEVVSAQLQRLLVGSNYPAVNSSQVARLEVTCPRTLPEQQAIATILSDMDSEIAALEHRLDKTRAIKQGMMQQLLTGSIRLPIPDADTEDAAHDA